MASEIEDFIRQAAIARGIDPNVALRVAGHEGGFKDPYQRSVLSAPGSQVGGGTENSIGPFQLYISGRGKGLGDRALAAGIDPRKDWKAGVNFALDQAKQSGWGDWMGAKAAGITGMTGIGGRVPGMSITSTPVDVASGAPAPPLPPPVNIQDHPVATVADATTPPAANPIMDAITKLTTDGPNGKASPLGALANTFSAGQQAPKDDPIIQTGALQSSDNLDVSRMANAQQLMAQLIAKRKQRVTPGFGITGMMG